MGSQAIAASQERKPVVPLTTACWADRQGVSKSTAEAATIGQRQALDQERNRADTLARELATLRTELDTARMVGKEAAQAIEVGIRQTQALEQERNGASNLARELTFLRAELDAARNTASGTAKATAARGPVP